MKTYILQKDAPYNKAGTEFLEGLTAYYVAGILQPKVGDGHVFPKDFVENDDGTWFKLKEDPEIEKAKKLLLSNGYEVLQFAQRLEFETAATSTIQKLYTREDMRKCFLDAYGFGRSFSIEKNFTQTRPIEPSFDFYLQSLNK